jgi:hydrogenase maturation factor
MCIAQIAKVKSVAGQRAVMENGRLVRIDHLKQVKQGDYLEIYANLALSKIDRYINKGNI